MRAAPWWTKQETGGRISGGEMYHRNNQPYNRERAMARAYTSLTPYKRAPVRGTMEARRLQAIARGRPRRAPNQPRMRRIKKKKLYYNARPSAAGSTFTRLVFGNPRPPKAYSILYKQNQEYLYEYLQSRREVSAFGKQNVHLLTYNDQNSLFQMFATIPAIGASPTIYQTGKFIIQSMTSKRTFTNQDLATAYVTIYSVIPRFHVPAGSNPEALWDKGLEDQQLVPGVNDNYRDAYAKPFASQNFCLYYKVEKVTTFELQQGQSHCHETTWHINKEVHGQLAQAFSSLRDITKFELTVISGTPINDLTTKTSVSTSSCAVDIVEKISKKYTYAASQRTIRTYVNTLPAIATAEIASIGAGIVVAEDEA